MTRRRKTLLVALALVLAAGGFAWYWQATAVHRQVNALLAELREDEPGLAERWLIKLGLMRDRRTGRAWNEVAEDLAKLGRSAAGELIRALRDRDWRVRCAAVQALGDLGDPRGVEPLIAALKDESRLVRYTAAWALGELGDARGVEPLIAALNDGDWALRYCAARALGKLGDARAVGPLKELLSDENEDVRKAATGALEKLRGPSEGKP